MTATAANPLASLSREEINRNYQQYLRSIGADGAPKVDAKAYPTEIWNGTAYGDFANLCTVGNNIPAGTFIEAFKTLTGAVLGDRLQSNIDGAVPRFYTVLLGEQQSGKGTAIGRACEVFASAPQGHTARMLYGPADEELKIIGACKAAFSSAPGLHRIAMGRTARGGEVVNHPQSRIISVAEELDGFLASGGFQGSGTAMLSCIRQLYDGTEYRVDATAERDPIGGGPVMYSLLGGITPDLWSTIFAGQNAPGSGLFGRFNLFDIGPVQRVAGLDKPNLAPFQNELYRRLMPLEQKIGYLPATKPAQAAVDEWYSRFSGQTDSVDEYSRLNILVWRNALHLAWLKDAACIETDHVLSAIKLGDYQFATRGLYRPLTGHSPVAVLENAIRQFIKAKGPVTKRDIVRALARLKAKYGSGVWDQAFQAATGQTKAQTEARGHGQSATTYRFTED